MLGTVRPLFCLNVKNKIALWTLVTFAKVSILFLAEEQKFERFVQAEIVCPEALDYDPDIIQPHQLVPLEITCPLQPEFKFKVLVSSHSLSTIQTVHLVIVLRQNLPLPTYPTKDIETGIILLIIYIKKMT